MRKPSILVTVLAAAPFVLGAALSAMAACSSPDGVSPDCVFNVDANGIHAMTNGCEGFAPCLDKNNNPQPASKCCVDEHGTPYSGDTLATCLFGFGEGSLPSTTSSASSSSGGTGGTGGAGH